MSIKLTYFEDDGTVSWDCITPYCDVNLSEILIPNETMIVKCPQCYAEYSLELLKNNISCKLEVGGRCEFVETGKKEEEKDKANLRKRNALCLLQKENTHDNKNKTIEKFLNILNNGDVIPFSQIPLSIAKDLRVQKHLSSKDQKIVKRELAFETNTVEGFRKYFSFCKSEDQIYAIYRMVKENKISILENLQTNHVFPDILLNLVKRRDTSFLESVEKLMDEVLKRTSENQTIIDSFLLARCPNVESRVKYCEGRLWPKKNNSKNEDNFIDDRAWCPRLRHCCSLSISENKSYKYKGARLYPNMSAEIKKWSLIEFFHGLRITPRYPKVKSKEFVTRLAGWVNRLIEIRDAMRCSFCNKFYISNMKYAKKLASYNATVFTCPNYEVGSKHDKNVYLSHCWACGTMIDSRKCKQKIENIYLCLKCGSGPKKSTNYIQGMICPNCGSQRIIKDKYGGWNKDGRKKYCLECGHKFRIPRDHKLTGI